MRKVYQQKNQFSNSAAIRFTVKGVSKTVIFESKRKNGILTYETNDADVQDAIEESKQFEEGKITCIEGASSIKLQASSKENAGDSGASGDGGKKDAETKEYPEVTEWQAAKELLRSEPYNVPFQSLNTPGNILKKAEEMGVSFPNLKGE